MKVTFWASGILALVGGLLMVISGYASHSLLFTALGYAAEEIPGYLTGIVAGAASTAVVILELMIAFGGLLVFLGGVAILSRHLRTGRLIIFFGGGAGLVGLLVSLGYTTYSLGPNRALAYAPYWVGLAMAVVSRSLAKRA